MMKKGVSGFPSLIFVIIVFLIVVAILFIIYIAVDGRADMFFNAIRDIFSGFSPKIS